MRRPEHVALLRGIGAKHVVNSSLDSFEADLVEALADTGATLAFDATGGGGLPGRILAAMEMAQARLGGAATPYGTAVHKQVYIYGGLQRGPTVFDRAFGMAWGMGGWLLPIYLERVGPEESERAAATRRGRDQDHVREQLREDGVPQAGGHAGGGRRVRADVHGGEVPGRAAAVTRGATRSRRSGVRSGS